MAGIIGQSIRRSRRIAGSTCPLGPGNQEVDLLTQEMGAWEDMEPPAVVSQEPAPLLLSSDEASVQTRAVS